jgi:hypothetical protein
VDPAVEHLIPSPLQHEIFLEHPSRFSLCCFHGRHIKAAGMVFARLSLFLSFFLARRLALFMHHNVFVRHLVDYISYFTY